MHGTDVATADDLVLLSSVAAITVSAPPAEHAAAATSTAAATATTTTSTATATATPTTTAAMPTSTKPQHGRPNTLGRMGLTDSFDLMPGFKPFDLKPTKRSDSPAPSDVVLHPPLASPTPPKSPPHQVPARVVEHRVSESDEDLPPLCTAVPCSSPTSPNCAINYKQQQQHQRTGELHEEADESESDDDASGDDEEEHDGEQNDDDDDGDEEDQDFCFENQADDDDDDDDDDNCDLGYSDTPSPHLRRFSLVEEDSWSSSDEEATGDANEGEYQGDSDSDSDSSQDPGYSSDSDDSVVVFATEDDDDENNDDYDGNTAALPHAPLLPFWYSHEEPFQIRAIHAMYSAQLLPPRSIYSREPPAFIATIQRRLLMSTGDELQTLDHVAVYYREPVDPGKPMRRRSTATALTTWDQLDGLPTRIELTTECQRRHLERTRLAPGPASDLICLPDFYSSEDYVFSVSNNRESRCMPVSYSPATLRHPYPPALLPSRRDTDGDGDDDEDGEFVDGVGLIHA